MGWGCHPVGGSDTESVTPSGGKAGRGGPGVQLRPAFGVFVGAVWCPSVSSECVRTGSVGAVWACASRYSARMFMLDGQ